MLALRYVGALIPKRYSEAVVDAQGRVTATARANAEDLLGFVLTDLEEQLTDFGQLPIQLDVSRTAVAYYAGLPAELRNAQTRLAHARALANLGAILDVQGKTAEAHRTLDEAVAMFEEVMGACAGVRRPGSAALEKINAALR